MTRQPTLSSAHMATEADREVRATFTGYPPTIRKKLLELRALILDTGASIEAVGPITETLKWGEPAYLTEVSKSGSTIRLGWKAATPSRFFMYFICRTNLVDTFRTLFPELTFDGNRAIVFEEDQPIPADEISRCIAMALTYHSNRTQNAS